MKLLIKCICFKTNFHINNLLLNSVYSSFFLSLVFLMACIIFSDSTNVPYSMNVLGFHTCLFTFLLSFASDHTGLHFFLYLVWAFFRQHPSSQMSLRNCVCLSSISLFFISKYQILLCGPLKICVEVSACSASFNFCLNKGTKNSPPSESVIEILNWLGLSWRNFILDWMYIFLL